MRWKAKQKPQPNLYKENETARVTKFALWPVRCDDGYLSWLETVIYTYRARENTHSLPGSQYTTFEWGMDMDMFEQKYYTYHDDWELISIRSVSHD